MTSLRFQVVAAALASLALHAGLLAVFRPAGGTSLQATAAPLRVRMLAASPAAVPALATALVAATEAAPGEPAKSDAATSFAAASRSAEPATAARRAASGEGALPDSERTHPSAPAPAGARESGLPPAPDYVIGARLDPGPTPLDDIEPAFPPEAGAQEGVVLLRILISETGKVDDVAVIRSAPAGLFESAALVAFQSARFSPGKVLGVPVKSQINVQVDFTPFNRGAAVSGHGY